jgi:hypothetical protein
MKNLTLAKSIAVLGTLAIAAVGGRAYALEPGSSDPHLPGFTDGVPAGALPPPGFYFANTLTYQAVSQKDANGNNLRSPPGAFNGINAIAWIDNPAVEWVSPFHFLGASYAVAAIEPIVTLGTTTNVPGASIGANRTGLFNTVIVPAILSWHLPAGFFVSASLPIYLPDGDTGDRGNGTSKQAIHIANNTTGFGPSAAVSWFNGHGLETSIAMEYDIQTQNTNFQNTPGVSIKYQSGDVLNLDFTVVQVLPGAYKKWTIGGVGYYSAQTSDDQVTINGATTTVPANFGGLQNGTGNRFEKFGLGPYVGYDFGPILLNFWYTRDIFANNAAAGDTFWFRFAFPL